MATMIDLAALQAAQVMTQPYSYFIVPRFVTTEALAAIESDYPDIQLPGSFPLPTLSYGARFAQLMQEIQGVDMARIVGEKLGLDLSGHPTMVTVRGYCRPTDGQIHTDSTTKLVTVLIYMNGKWEKTGGRLRLLRSNHNLDDAFAEVPPEQGTLLVFKNQPDAWHGHESCEGPRRVIQLNWVTNMGVVRREQLRHRVSAFFKNLRKMG
jgi:SM-20-related protein